AVDAAPGVSARFAGRREDPRLLKGEGRYSADWNFPGQLYGAFLRSDRAHAELRSINVQGARTASGVVAVFTGADVQHFKTPPPHESVPGNLAFDYDYGDEAAAAAAIARAAHVTRLTLASTRVSGNPMEPKACVALYHPAEDAYDVYASSQGMSLMVPNLAAITGTPAERIRLHAQDVGGGFGVRSQAYPEYCALMHAAKTLGKPVKWV